MEPFDLFGTLKIQSTQRLAYRVEGVKQKTKFSVTLTVSDFRGKAWRARASLSELAECQYDYAVEAGQLYIWLLKRFSANEDIVWHSSDDTFVTVGVTEGDIEIEVRLPIEGSLAPLSRDEQAEADAEFAFAMLDELQEHKQVVQTSLRLLQLHA